MYTACQEAMQKYAQELTEAEQQVQTEEAI